MRNRGLFQLRWLSLRFVHCACLLMAGVFAISSCGDVGGGADTSAYSISGTVRGVASAGVEIDLSGPTTARTVTDANGNYRFSGLTNGIYSIMPLRGESRIVFEPSALTVAISGSSVVNQNFIQVVTSVAASDIQFLPASQSSRKQYRVSLVPAADGLYFTDSSDTPLKKVDVQSGTITPLAVRIGTPESVAISGEHVFWVDGNRLNKTALDGTSTTILQAGNRDRQHGVTSDLVVDDTSVYWVNNVSSANCPPPCSWTIQRVPRAGGTPVTLVNTTRKIVALTADADYIYWEESDFFPVYAGCDCGSSIKMIPKGGGGIIVLVDGLLNGPLPAPGAGTVPASWLPTGGIAVSGSRLFFGVADPSGYQIMSVAVAGSAPTTLATVHSSAGQATSSIKSLNSDGTNVYWVDPANATINSVPILGGAVVSLATGISSPGGLLVGGGMAFWTEAGSIQGCCLQVGAGSIRQVPLAGGTASTVVGNLDAPVALAIDASGNIVWAEYWRVAKLDSAGGATTLASGISSDLPRIAADRTNLYVLDNGLIKSMSLSGGMLERLAAARGTNIDDLGGRDHDIAADSTSVYWSELSDGTNAVTVRKVPTSGGAVVTLAADTEFGWGPGDCYWRIAVDTQNVYWSTPSPSFPLGCAIKKVPIAGGAVTTLVDLDDLFDFTIDGVNVYLTGGIRRVSVDGGLITTVIPTRATVLAVDAQNVYWLEGSNVWGAPKSAGTADSARLLAAAPSNTVPLRLRVPVYDSLVVSQGVYYWSASVSGSIFFAILP